MLVQYMYHIAKTNYMKRISQRLQMKDGRQHSVWYCWTKQHHPVSKISNWPENPKNLTTECSEFHLCQTYVFADWKFGIRISHMPKGVNVNTNYDGIKLAVRSISHSGHTSDIIVSASIVPSCAKPAEHLDAQKECRKCAQILVKPISPI